MKKWIIGIAIVLIIAGIAFFVFKSTSKGKKMHYAKIISEQTGVTWKTYMKLEEEYLKARADAYKQKQPVFAYGGSNFKTGDGTKIV